MKFLMLSVLLSLGACAVKKAEVAPPKPAAEEAKKLVFKKFFLSYLKTAQEEDECVYLESKESEKTLHFMFICGDRLVHVGFLK